VTEPNAEDTFDEGLDEDTLDEDVDIEAPEADLIEQHAAARTARKTTTRREAPFEADAADAADQDRDAQTDDDEDDYR
jgi:hypothetical protein